MRALSLGRLEVRIEAMEVCLLTKLSSSRGHGRSLQNFRHEDRLVGLSALEGYSVIKHVGCALEVLRWGFAAVCCQLLDVAVTAFETRLG